VVSEKWRRGVEDNQRDNPKRQTNAASTFENKPSANCGRAEGETEPRSLKVKPGPGGHPHKCP